MRVKEIRLYKYKRFFLNNITEIIYTPEEHIQIILGSNGSGKSSLLKELNPLPADLTRDYNEGGYKYVVVEHLGNEYVLSSGYVSKGKHSCMLDGVELNPGGTRKVQLELIKDHFNITPAIVEILLNNERLTTMSPSVRKGWFTELSTVDYTYPIGVYNKLKQRHRDIVGGIKLLQEDIIRNETNNQSIDIALLENNRLHLEKYIEYITSLYEHNIKIYTTDTVGDIVRSTKELKTILENNTFSNITKEELSKNIELATDRVSLINSEIIKIGKEIDLLDKIQSSRDVLKVEQELTDVTRTIEEITKSMYIPINLNMIDTVYDVYNNHITELTSTIELLKSVDEYRTYDKEKCANTVKEYEHISIRLNSLQKRLLSTSDEIEHMEKHKNNEDNMSTCPKCTHVFNNKYDELVVGRLKRDKVSIEEEIDKTKKEVLELERVVSKIRERDDIKNQIRNILVNTPECSVIWKYVWDVVDYNSSSVTTILNTLNKVLIDLSSWVKCKEYMNTKESLSKELEHVKGLIKLNNEHNQNKIEELTKTLDNLTLEKNEKLNYIEVYKKEVKILTDMEYIYNTLLNGLKTLNKSFTSNVLTIRNKHLTELVNELKSELVKIDHILNNHKQHVNKLNKDKLLLQDYKNREKVLNYMVKELSPSEGLIAKSINSFLNVFITEMNNVINSIWSYSMELLPCDVSDNDLDYKFKVRVNNSEVPQEDVSKLSTSMQEIVDLAFRLVFAKYMHLKDTPLYLDEFGRTFDKKHRTTAYSVIDKIISSDYKQIFIVSHYESLYGSLRNVDISVINEDNIDLDSTVKYNQVLKIK